MHPLEFIIMVVGFSMIATGIIICIDQAIQEDEDEL